MNEFIEKLRNSLVQKDSGRSISIPTGNGEFNFSYAASAEMDMMRYERQVLYDFELKYRSRIGVIDQQRRQYESPIESTGGEAVDLAVQDIFDKLYGPFVDELDKIRGLIYQGENGRSASAIADLIYSVRDVGSTRRSPEETGWDDLAENLKNRERSLYTDFRTNNTAGGVRQQMELTPDLVETLRSGMSDGIPKSPGVSKSPEKTSEPRVKETYSRALNF